MTLPPCEWCGAKYGEGQIGTDHAKDCRLNWPTCIRCDCLIAPPDRWQGLVPYGQTYYQRHATPELCLVAIKAKEAK